MSDEGAEAPREPTTVEPPTHTEPQPAATQPPAPPPVAEAPPPVAGPAAAPGPYGRRPGGVLITIAVGFAGMLLGGLIGVAATTAVDHWHDRHGPVSERGPAWFDDGPRR